jgi:sugar phosphate isomerase/epimerase
MVQTIDRREFLKQSATVAAGLGLMRLNHRNAHAFDRKPLFKLSLAEWSLHQTLFSKKLDNLDFPKVAKMDFGISAVEYVNQFFQDKARDQKYLAELKKRTKDLGVENRLIMIDGEGDLGDADDAKRKLAVENHYRWVEAAKFLGCFCIRVNAQSSGSYEEQIKLAADGLRKLTEFGARHRIAVIVENHGGLSSNGQWLAAVIKRVDHSMCGTLPDFGNFDLGGGQEYDRYKGVKELMPFAKAVSAKSHDFDEKGNEIHTDYRRMLKIVADAGYHSYLGIEYEGEKMSEPDGIRATKKLIERVQEEMAKK